MSGHISVVGTLLSDPATPSVSSRVGGFSLFDRFWVILVFLVLLWLAVFALGYVAEAASWLADTFRARRRGSRG